MKITIVAVMAAMVGTSLPAGAVPAAEAQVVVCFVDLQDMRVENGAKIVASAIFGRIGVKIQWHGPSNCPREGILITLLNETPGDLLPGALAFAQPFEGTHIVVFYDRVKNRPGNVQCLLGHVISHEVAHILQGLKRHSESGIMKAQWTGADYQQMTWEPLRFTDEDVMLIHRGLQARVDHSLQ